MSNGGKKAVKWGKWLENSVAALLNDEYEAVDRKEFLDLRHDRKPIYTKEFVIGESIYGGQRRVDFILYHPQRWPRCLVIECKWQSEPGTVDVKYPYEVASINHNKYKTIIVLDGEGYRASARDWLKAQAGKGKLLHVMNFNEIKRFQSKKKL